MNTPNFGPTPAELDQKTAKLVATAVRVRTEKELRMIPNGHPDQAKYAGHHHSEFGRMTPKINFVPPGMDSGGFYLGTPQQWQEAEHQYDWIPRVFQLQLDADPRNFDNLIAAAKRLTEGFVGAKQPEGAPWPQGLPEGYGAADMPITEAVARVGDWKGNFADEFLTYLREFPIVTRRQDALAQSLYQSIIAARDVYAGARVLLGNIADCTINALDSTNASPAGSKNGINIVFGVLAGAAGVVSGGTALAGWAATSAVWNIVAGVSSGISSGANLLVDKEPPPVDVAADTVDGVLLKMNQALRVHRTTISDMEDKYARTLGELVGNIDSNTVGSADTAKHNAFLPRRPQALDMKTGLKDLKDHQTGFTHANAH